MKANGFQRRFYHERKESEQTSKQEQPKEQPQRMRWEM
jgi:hypothetical protein